MKDPLDFAVDLALRAGQLLCDYYHRQHTIQHKSSEIDLVTEADLASEELIVRAIRDRFPDHAILAEEGMGTLRGDPIDEPYLWLVDPLDGTVNYAHGYPVWGVTLALAKAGRVILGVSHAPLRGETCWSERGGGAWLDGEKLLVSDVARMRDALVATGFSYKRATQAHNNLPQFEAVMPKVQGVRRAGAALLDLADVASGRLDAYWEMHLNPWDWAAGTLLVEEAGGVVTDMCGLPWSLKSPTIAASNGLLHDQLIKLLDYSRAAPG